MTVNANVRTNPPGRLQTRAAQADVTVVAKSKAIHAELATAAHGVSDRRLLQPVDEERVRLGRELHDDIGQQVALLGLGLEQLNNQMTCAPKDVRTLLTSLMSQASGVGATVQPISRRLHPPTLQYLGLFRAIRTFCGEVSASQAIQVEYMRRRIAVIELQRVGPAPALVIFNFRARSPDFSPASSWSARLRPMGLVSTRSRRATVSNSTLLRSSA